MPRIETHVRHLHPVDIVRSGRRGRPRKLINPELLKELTSSRRRGNIANIARILRVSRPTVYEQLKANDIDRSLSQISDEDLDEICRRFVVPSFTAGCTSH